MLKFVTHTRTNIWAGFVEISSLFSSFLLFIVYSAERSERVFFDFFLSCLHDFTETHDERESFFEPTDSHDPHDMYATNCLSPLRFFVYDGMMCSGWSGWWISRHQI